ncbi:hypothetical protein B0H63DRAFT_517325 [Podospora didyma]|uniref:Uncharacterized protein n=1 Tax=Podospora didyma TaxID=330526 RepID=A0AAE0P6B9_9PEZI|nr:hypothetical protein B0H63DRAFT_517325 [Podospora didyma]
MTPDTCSSLQNSEESNEDEVPCGWAFETSEIAMGLLCSIVTWKYTVMNELRQSSFHGQHDGGGNNVDLRHRLFTAAMLFSCLVFGISVSSFWHRRQEKDSLQSVIYAVVLAAAVVIGHGLQASANLILLGYLPWATCAAMAISISAHSLYRWRYAAETGLVDEEKGQILLV